MHAVLMLSIHHLIYVSIYVCCFKLIIFMHFNMICISKHYIMLLATLLLQIYPNYVLYGMYEIGVCLYVIVLTLFYTRHTLHYMLILFHRGILHTDIFIF